VDRDRLCNVAKLGFEWSSFIERKGRRRRPLLVVASGDQRPSQVATGDSESSQDLMCHRRSGQGPAADGGAHGPAHGSPSAASARIIRGDKVRQSAPDLGLRSARADAKTDKPAIHAQRPPATEGRGDNDSARRPQMIAKDTVALYARVSSESQARNNTIGSQITVLRERIAADGFQLEPDHTYVERATVVANPVSTGIRDAVAGSGRTHLCPCSRPARSPLRPFGYRYVSRTQGDGVARFEVVEEEAQVVRLIFAWIGLDRVGNELVCLHHPRHA
jgi:hypothetical protein